MNLFFIELTTHLYVIMEKKIRYIETSLFKKDLKKLLKRFRTLEEDLIVAKRDAIELFHIKNLDNRSIIPIIGFCSEEIKIYKIKKFACKSIKNRGAMSGIRVIYALKEKELVIDFIEIYFKGDKENEDKERIKLYLRNI